MRKEPERELFLQSDDSTEDHIMEPIESDVTPALSERLFSWLESVDR